MQLYSRSSPITRDYKGKTVNLSYKPYTQGSPSLTVSFTYRTQFFSLCYSRVAWMISWRICLCVASFQSEGKRSPLWGCLLLHKYERAKGVATSNLKKSFNERLMNERQTNEQPNECKAKVFISLPEML